LERHGTEGKLITKVHQVERSQTLWLVLDAGRLLRARANGLTKLDYAVNAALSLAQVAFYSGDRVALLAYGRKPQQRLGPGRGVPHLRALIESLAQVRAESFEADHLLAAEVLLSSQSRRSLIVWLTRRRRDRGDTRSNRMHRNDGQAASRSGGNHGPDRVAQPRRGGARKRPGYVPL